MPHPSRQLTTGLTRPLRTSWWTVVAGVCCGLAAGILAQQHAPRVYRATSSIRVAADEAGALRSAALDARNLARLTGDAEAAGESARVVERLTRSVSVERGSEEGVFLLNVRDRDPQRAARFANRWSEVLATADPRSFDVVAAAEVPSRPVAPRAPAVYALGLVVGLLVFVGPVLVRSAVSPVIFDETDIGDVTRIPVLMSFSRVRTPGTRGARRRRFLVNAALSIVAGAILVAAALRVFA